jgi:GxxExxY protein
MPYDGEPTPYEDAYEPPAELDQLVRRVIGAAIEVHRTLGPGFVEEAYGNALAVELERQEIPFQREFVIPVLYKQVKVASHRLDFLIDGQLILEIKASDGLAPIHKAQVIGYLRAAGFRLALPINFNVPILKQGIQRIILS